MSPALSTTSPSTDGASIVLTRMFWEVGRKGRRGTGNEATQQNSENYLKSLRISKGNIKQTNSQFSHQNNALKLIWYAWAWQRERLFRRNHGRKTSRKQQSGINIPREDRTSIQSKQLAPQDQKLSTKTMSSIQARQQHHTKACQQNIQLVASRSRLKT